MSDPTATWLDTYEPLRGLLADALDLVCMSPEGKVAIAYCNLAHAAKHPRTSADECMAVCAGDLLSEVAEQLRLDVRARLGSERPAASVRECNDYSIRAAAIIPRLVDLMGAASGEVRP